MPKKITAKVFNNQSVIYYVICEDGTEIESNDLTESLLLWFNYYLEQPEKGREACNVGKLG